MPRGDPPPDEFGMRLKSLRTAARLTQAALAEAVGLHPNSLARLERGELRPAWQTVLRLAAALGVDVGGFAGGTKKK